MSNSNLIISGEILTGNNNKLWVELENTKEYYRDLIQTFFNACTSKAFEQGFNIGNLNESNKLVIIYAGNQYTGGALWPHASISQNYYVMSEKYKHSLYDVEGQGDKFAHIGTHAHEFGHLLGLKDLYHAQQRNYSWDLMSWGNSNGPDLNGACPAPINPVNRYVLGWVDYTEVQDGYSENALYSLSNPKLFKLNIKEGGESYILVEYREFNSNMTIGTTQCLDYNAYIQFGNLSNGFLAWRREFKDGSPPISEMKYGKLIHANGLDTPFDQSIYQGFMFPGNKNVRVLSPWSDPRIPGPDSYYVPNTKPSIAEGTTINVGFEVKNNLDGSYRIYLYTTNPENASPARPLYLELSGEFNQEVILSWNPNTEPDVVDGGSYYIFKSEVWGTEEPTNWWLETTIDAYDNSTPVTSWIDYNSLIYSGPRWLHYKILAVDNSQKESVTSDVAKINARYLKLMQPQEFVKGNTFYKLYQSYPNPFNSSTNIMYQIPEDSFVSLTIYDAIGTQVYQLVNEYKTAGEHSITFNAYNLTSGIYYCKFSVNDFTDITKIILLR
jgi:M6 family metalloprotease-like protein